ncbi:MAG: DUF2232 domain-containing protein [Bdellovibrionaceae bacterium]|nr:DUF2232 domain-containing protein [Bdellovibrio sp.]
MSLLTQKNNKKVWALGLASVATSILFSFLGAPFLRAFSVSARSTVFWFVGIVFVASLYLLGTAENQLSQAAVYVGAIWMTLGTYAELEKRGISWKKTGTLALLAGIIFAWIGYTLVSKNQSVPNTTLIQIVEPIQQSIKQAFPESKIDTAMLVGYLPGMFVASLFGALALGFLLESRVSKMFQIQREKVATGLRGLEFRLPDLFIWVSLFALLFAVIDFDQKLLKVVSINLLIFAGVAFFFQGLAVVEFTMRFLRFGPLGRVMTYVLILFQLAPFIVLVGLVDYWADFRRLMRKKAKGPA